MAAALDQGKERLGRLASRLLYFSSVGSTNDIASQLAASDDAEGAVVIAEQQTSGRGRRGHSWFSPRAAGLYVSVVLAPSTARVDSMRATRLVTLAAGVAVAEAVE